MASRVKPFLLDNAPLLTTMMVFILAYFIGGQMYPAMQKPQAFFNLFINNGSLLLVSIGMTVVILTGGIDLSVGLDNSRLSGIAEKWLKPCSSDTIDVAHGYYLWVYLWQPYSLLQSASFYRDPNGLIFRAWHGLHHQP
jgi:ABC-type xylose transport system permease subunit